MGTADNRMRCRLLQLLLGIIGQCLHNLQFEPMEERYPRIMAVRIVELIQLIYPLPELILQFLQFALFAKLAVTHFERKL